jgi:hypothetical protein
MFETVNENRNWHDICVNVFISLKKLIISKTDSVTLKVQKKSWKVKEAFIFGKASLKFPIIAKQSI